MHVPYQRYFTFWYITPSKYGDIQLWDTLYIMYIMILALDRGFGIIWSPDLRYAGKNLTIMVGVHGTTRPDGPHLNFPIQKKRNDSNSKGIRLGPS
jgi:hypothetical protein